MNENGPGGRDGLKKTEAGMDSDRWCLLEAPGLATGISILEIHLFHIKNNYK